MLGLLLAVHIVDSLIRFGIAPLAPFIMNDLGISKGSFGLLSASIRMSGIPLAVAAGMTVDRIGPRRSLITVGVAVMSVLSLFFLPLTYGRAFFLFFLTGASISLISPLGSTGIMRWFPLRERGLAFGIKQMGVPAGGALTALLLPTLALRFGWQHTFAIVGIVAGIGALAASLVYRDPPAFAKAEAAARRAHAPRPPRVSAWQVLRTPGVALLILMGSSFAGIQTSILSFAVPFLEETGLSVVAAGAYLSLSQIAGMAGRPLAGIVSDKVFDGRRKPVLVTNVVLVVCVVSTLALTANSLGPFWLGVMMVIVGACTMAWAGVFFASTMERAAAGAVGTASGVSSTANMIGSLIGVPIFGFIVDATSFPTAFLVFSGWLAFVGLLLVLFLQDVQPPEGR